MKLTRIKNFRTGDSIKGFYQLTQMNRRTTRKGDAFLDCVLSDKTGSVSAKWWNVPEAAFDWLNPGIVVAVTGEVEEYNDARQLVVEQITPAKEGQVEKFGWAFSDIVPSTTYDPDQMWEKVQEIIDSFEEEHLQKLVRRIYHDFEEEIATHPGSVSHHHLYRGGFLEHVWSLTQLGEFVADHYFELDRDLFLAGLFLHDIGKLLEIKSDFERQYTDEGQFIGHIVLGRDLVRETVEDYFPEFPDDLLIRLEHVILAHQEEPAMGSPKRPATLEALAVAMLDRFDTRMEQFLMTLRNDTNTGEWTLPTRLFPYPLHKGVGDDEE
ncbi:MAG: HD domain-containing protein [Candidatus Marinimicrobia bacterium]|nr:HD domain-containing protein [Candidatus Neomarinimicrobiota bacterium]MCF7828580.1 HD domain-containing protein [Candidatus Neomarinimicrobiota bacterium]MCF7880321.1 HD domain-containing protein [Candidatus Neomarinimicrobiota bacterium]